MGVCDLCGMLHKQQPSIPSGCTVNDYCNSWHKRVLGRAMGVFKALLVLGLFLMLFQLLFTPWACLFLHTARCTCYRFRLKLFIAFNAQDDGSSVPLIINADVDPNERVIDCHDAQPESSLSIRLCGGYGTALYTYLLPGDGSDNAGTAVPRP